MNNKKIGFISGCFDGFHEGHIFILNEIKKHCDYLIISINDDDYIRCNKNREPLMSAEERKVVIYHRELADEVIVFKEDTPIKIIEFLKPDIIFCGSDYTEDQVVGHELAEVVLIDRLPNISTTERIIRKRIRDYYEEKEGK